MFKRAAQKNSNNNQYQLWQQHNQPIALITAEMFKQKLDYMHNNPVKAGFVELPEHWKYSSAIDYSGGRGLIDIIHG
jgi:putative transposase